MINIYCVQSKDIFVLHRVIFAIYIACINDGSCKNLIVIRCKESLDPYYLKAFFESESGKNLLKSVQTGSMIFAINPKQIKEIAIELLEIEKQKMIGEKAKWMVKTWN